MSDPLQQASEATKTAAGTLSWWQLFLGTTTGAIVLRAILTFFRRLTNWDAQVSAEGRLRDELMKARAEEAKTATMERVTLLAELAALRKSSIEEQEKTEERLRVALDALHEAELANIDAARRVAELEARLKERGEPVEASPYLATRRKE